MNKHLPFIVELEKLMLAAFLQDRKLWASFFEHIEPHYFNDSINERIFKYFKAYFNKYKNLPTKENIQSFLTQKSNYDKKTENVIHYIYDKKGNIEKHEIISLDDEIFKFIKETKLESAILKGAELLKEENYDDIEQIIKKAVSWNHNIDLGMHIADVRRRFQEVDELYENVITTPWPRLDTILGGGIFRKTLTVFTAASSVGKSIALDQLAFHIWDKLKKNVVMITLEVSEVRKAMRMDSYGTQIPIKEIRGERNKIFKFYEQRNDYKNRLYIKEFPTSSVNMNNIKQYLYHLELFAGLNPEDIGALLIDYGDILLPVQRRVGKTYDDQGNTFENIRATAQEYGFPAISASQLRRSGIDMSVDDLNEAQLADSIKKLFIADNLIGIVSTAEDRAKNHMFYKSMKARDGIKDQIITLNVDYPRLTINDRSANMQSTNTLEDED